MVLGTEVVNKPHNINQRDPGMDDRELSLTPTMEDLVLVMVIEVIWLLQA